MSRWKAWSIFVQGMLVAGFALLGVYGQSIFVDPELRLVMVITAAAKTARVGKQPLGRERHAVWRALVRKYGTW